MKHILAKVKLLTHESSQHRYNAHIVVLKYGCNAFSCGDQLCICVTVLSDDEKKTTTAGGPLSPAVIAW